MTIEATDSGQGAADERPGSEWAQATARGVGIAAVIIMLGNLTTSALGFVRQATIAKVFGDTLNTDAFFAASIVPQMFYDLTIGAAVSAALIPIFAEIVAARDESELWETFGSVLAIAWIALAAVIAALLLLARPLMGLILLGFHTQMRAGAFDLSVEIARLLIPTLFFLGTSAVLLSALYALRRFTVPAFATAFYHLGIIIGAVLLARPLGILALPVGALAGSALQAVVQVPGLIRAGAHLRPRPVLSPEVRQIMRLYAPVAAGLLVSIAGQIIDMGFKSQLGNGAITSMQLATTLTQFPIGIAVAALGFAVLPSISTDAAFDRMGDFKDTLALGLRLVLFLTVPAALGYVALATPLVSLLFQHGHFTSAATARTSGALTAYALQIPFVGVDQLLIFAFYARKNTVTPMLVGVLGVFIYIASALLLMPRLHIFGLALANTIQNSAHGLILLALLFTAIGTLEGRGVLRATGKAVVGGAVAAGGAAALAAALHSRVNPSILTGQAVEVMLPVAAAVVLYVGAAAAMRSQELELVWEIGRRKLA